MRLPDELWPATAQAFTDEFGRIDHEVYEAARLLWLSSHSPIQQTIHDVAAAHRWLMKACALVTRQRQTAPEEIKNLPAYLGQTWRRLLLAEIKKEDGHHDMLRAAAELQPGDDAVEQLDNRIFLQEVISYMDDWTREILQDLSLGLSFQEIAAERDSHAHTVRTRYRRKIEQLIKRLNLRKT